MIKDNHRVNTTDRFSVGCFNLFQLFDQVNDASSFKSNRYIKFIGYESCKSAPNKLRYHKSFRLRLLGLLFPVFGTNEKMGEVYTTPEKFENVALVLRLGLHFTLVDLENGACPQRFTKQRNLKTPASRFNVKGKHSGNRTFRKRRRHDILLINRE